MISSFFRVSAAGSDHALRRWFLIACLLLLPSLIFAASASQGQLDRPPRAALVSLASEHELDAILQSIQQLEESFNSRYLYHWVFFSTKPLSENFHRLTSNATNATCIYEQIPEAANAIEPRIVLNWTSHAFFGPHKRPTRSEVKSSVKWQRRSPRWDWASIAKADRLRDYDWFWRIEPGVSPIWRAGCRNTVTSSSLTCNPGRIPP
jgi:mannosyltransferase